MLKLALDVLVLSSLLTMLRGEDKPDLVQLAIIALGIAIANALCVVFLGAILGVLVIVLILVLDGLILMFFCSLTIQQALIALGFLVVYNIVYEITMRMLLT
jgi:putative Ca2+/H+ antiporter (TMEM165/GDT1 family)